MSKNDITGDSIQTKGFFTKQGEENFERIFGKKQSRIDTIGQNGNDGDHYEYELNKSTGVEKSFKDSINENEKLYQKLKDGVSKPNGEQFDE